MANDPKRSAELFDRVLELAPDVRPRLWQRGIALYYAGRFQEGKAQFRDDALLNPDDTEEAIWALLCACEAGARADLWDEEAASIAPIRNERRGVMRRLYRLFSNKESLEHALELRDGKSGYNDFQVSLYAALYLEARHQPEASRQYMLDALATNYAKTSGDFMADVARVHAEQRGWLA